MSIIKWHRLPLTLFELSQSCLTPQATFASRSLPIRSSLRGHGHAHRHCSTTSTPSTAQKPTKLRFAPSPTGYLHLGGLRTVLYNHLLAKRLGATWALRIEDTDQVRRLPRDLIRTRFVPGAVESLIKTLRWAKLDYDEGQRKRFRERTFRQRLIARELTLSLAGPYRDGGNGPYSQSERKHIYDALLQALIDVRPSKSKLRTRTDPHLTNRTPTTQSGKAYHCFCTAERLASTRKLLQKQGSNATYDRKCLGLSKEEVQARSDQGEASVVRFKSSSDGMTQHDLVYDTITYPSLPIEDFVLRKTDGLPTYHFASVVDDHSMGVTHVLRGEEWLPSTPKHLSLYSALGIDPPQFAHLPLLVNQDGSKLSKRAGDVRVEEYIDKGYEPEALLNFVALMGWSPQATTSTNVDASGQEGHVLTMEEMIKRVRLFSLEGVNKNRSTMNLSKLEYLNREHVKLKLGEKEGRKEMVERLKANVEREIGDAKKTDDPAYLGRVIEALKERLHTIHDIPRLGRYFFSPPDYTTKLARQMAKNVPLLIYRRSCSSTLKLRRGIAHLGTLRPTGETLSSTIELLQSLPDEDWIWSSETHHKMIETLNTLVEPGGNSKNVMMSLRHALTATKVGAGVPMTVLTLGKEESLARLQHALEERAGE
ncbi:BZ3500_MvSof-1268-A1-R1_Chr1-1g01115 [Microbotryum saponariae]|uniref:glutamate--tRNA ligase n=1 Tax=Microbotryum saponariae TaxID=289078 RepID=A0A2X0KN86_9BASI|nr:BZ3500_MvSof-1268-A1-R1_Chr1-1g01115 [Microbotryum saponariae]SCZ93408.1 BZ3501_MvSof-1269-A2-R1_Chr1-1g00712 [Microbotryum saponariae]